MRRAARFGLALIAMATPSAIAQQPRPAAPSGVIGSHQIDRYEAIRQLQAATRSEPNNVANWIILGELAHEVAVELPPEQDRAYYAISRDAYERALRLEPNNQGLRAAVKFAEDQEANAPRFDAQRRNAVSAYLAARRQELGQPGASPTVRVFEPPATPSPTPTASAPTVAAPSVPAPTTPAPAPIAATAAPSLPAPVYRPFYSTGGQPYTYEQYQGSSLPSVSSTAASMTPRVGASNPASTGGAVKPAAAAAPP